jgi:hypothetical protein
MRGETRRGRARRPSPGVPRAAAALLLLAAAGPGAAPAWGDELPPAGPGAEAPPEPVPEVPLDRLLELPSDFEPRVERRSGVAESEWRERFRLAREDLERAQATLASSKAELAELAEDSSSWSLAPPVGGPAQSNEAPLSYELRQRIKRQEAEVERARRKLRDLQVDANLAGVPESWRR